MRIIPLDEAPHVCGYLPDRMARYESFLVLEATPQERELLLASGYRAFGKHYFKPQCEGCIECIPLRIPVDTFTPNKSQRRLWKKSQTIRLEVGTPVFTEEKYEIYLDHLQRFNRPAARGSAEDFAFSFYDPSFPAWEFLYYVDDRLAAVGLVHEVPHALSSVYFTYRLEYSDLSLGTFSVLKEIEYAKQMGKKHLYLGYYVADNHFMRHKASFKPHEMLGPDGRWERASGRRLLPD